MIINKRKNDFINASMPRWVWLLVPALLLIMGIGILLGQQLARQNIYVFEDSAQITTRLEPISIRVLPLPPSIPSVPLSPVLSADLMAANAAQVAENARLSADSAQLVAENAQRVAENAAASADARTASR